MLKDFSDVRLHVVSGKGGTGKTTVAAALALGLAAGGRKVLLCEVEGRQGIAQVLDTPPVPYADTRVALAPGEVTGGPGGEVWACAIDPDDAMLDYLHMFYKLSANGIPARALRRMGAIEFATTVAPGLRDVLLTGKVREATTRKETRKGPDQGRYVYDAVVLDAPPTGRITRFLNISHEIGGLARTGPLKNQSDLVMAVLASPMTAVHLVTLLEEMPVQETVDAVAELRAAGLQVGGVVVNNVRAAQLSPAALAAVSAGTVDRAELAAGLERAGVTGDEGTVAGLLAEAGDHAVRVGLEEAGHDRLAALDLPTYELPRLLGGAGGMDLAGLYELAAALHEQGLA